MKERNIVLLVILLTLLSMTGSFISDTYLPALPDISRDLSTTQNYVQVTISVYLLGFAVSQLIYGRCADLFGRRKILFAGFSIVILGTLGCIFSPNIYILIVARLVQGLGAGAGVVVGRAAARDLFSGRKLAQIMSYMSLFFVLAPAFAPVVGGYLHELFSWQAIFVFIFIYVLLVLILAWLYLPETNSHKSSQHLTTWLEDCKVLIKNYEFIRYCYISTAALSGFFAYYAISPFLFQRVFGMSVVMYGWLAVIIGFFSAVSRFLNGMLVARMGIPAVVYIGLSLLCLSALAMLLGFYFLPSRSWVVLLPMIGFVMGAGFIFPNAFSGAMEDFANKAGTAASWFGFLQILGTCFVSWLVTKFPVTDQSVLAMTLLVLAVSAIFIYFFRFFAQWVGNQLGVITQKKSV